MGVPFKSSISTGFSLINHPFWGTPNLGNPYLIEWLTYILRSFHVILDLHALDELFYDLINDLCETHEFLDAFYQLPYFQEIHPERMY